MMLLGKQHTRKGRRVYSKRQVSFLESNIQEKQHSDDLSYLSWLIDHNLIDVGRRLEAWDNNEIAATVPTPPLAASRSEEMAIMGDGHVGIPINNDDIMQRQLLMDSMVAGNVTGTVPFGEVNSGVWPDLLP
ncbi:hypothetical protein MTR_4g032270 [Medicago truncatula]|uniref:Uncharacterized protein n=1 Tax=Medicago truncatula TaxID=3880 RepID=G7JN53_MEDTR|nr:hypothetical protein MTR_4g032270 [Medicago truncatula]